MFWRNISFSIFKFSPFLYIMRNCRWNLISFSKYINAFIRKEKKQSYSIVKEKRKTEKSWNLFYLKGCFTKPLKLAINHFFFNRPFLFTRFFLFRKLVHSAIFAFWCQDDASNIKRRNWKRQIATNSKLQYLFRK